VSAERTFAFIEPRRLAQNRAASSEPARRVEGERESSLALREKQRDGWNPKPRVGRMSWHRNAQGCVVRMTDRVAMDSSADADASAPRVLVVEDDPVLARLVQRILGPRYDVTVLGSGEQVLARRIESPPFDAIVADVGLPGMSGPLLLRTLLTLEPRLVGRVALMTGGGLAPEEADHLRDVPRLSKPFEVDDLRRLVARLVQRPFFTP